MKKLFILLLLFIFSTSARSQNTTTPNLITNRDSVYIDVDKGPEFPGGMGMFSQFLAKTLRYPAKAFTNGVQGRVVIQGVVEKDGSISNTKVISSVSKEIDAEALRVVNLSPHWKPAIKNDNAVRSSFAVPITFSLPLFH